MSVETVLDKISNHNSDIIGCIATRGDRVFHNLPGAYQVVDARALTEHAANMFTVMEELGSENPEFSQVFMEYQGHSVYAKRLDDGVLALVNKPIHRGLFKKMQIGVNLFIKPLKAALDAPEPAPEQVVADPPRKGSRFARLYRGRTA